MLIAIADNADQTDPTSKDILRNDTPRSIVCALSDRQDWTPAARLHTEIAERDSS